MIKIKINLFAANAFIMKEAAIGNILLPSNLFLF